MNTSNSLLALVLSLTLASKLAGNCVAATNAAGASAPSPSQPADDPPRAPGPGSSPTPFPPTTTPLAPAVITEEWKLCITDGKLRNAQQQFIPATVSNVVEFIRFLLPDNVVLAPGAGQIMIPDLKLSSIDWESALESMRVASGEAIEWNRRMARSPDPDHNTGVAAIYVVSPSSNQQALKGKQMEMFYLGNMTYIRADGRTSGHKELMDVLVQVIQDLVPGLTSNDFSLGYHPGASLLVVSGRADVVDIARRMILALPGTRSYSSESRSPTAQPDDETRRAFQRRYGLGLPGDLPPNQPAAPRSAPEAK